jgi:cytochrome c2
VLFALSTGHKLGLLIAAGILIGWALLCSFYFSHRQPDFPGAKGMKTFLAITGVVVIGMLAAVEVFGAEPKEASAEGTTTTTTATTTTTPAAAGDATAGKAVFTSAGCGACHTFTPAQASGKIGPNLDQAAKSVKPSGSASLDAYLRQSIVDPNAYIVPGFPKGIMPGNFGTSLTAKQIDDLIAFVASGQSS